MDFDAYKPAIKATEKALKDAQLKLASIKNDMEICLNFQKQMDLIRDLSYKATKAEVDAILKRGQNRKNLEQDAKRYTKELNRIQKLDASAIIQKEFDQEDVVRRLKHELVVLKNLKAHAGKTIHIFQC